jgi:exonuclease VII large subunit
VRGEEILQLRSPRELLDKGYAFISSKGIHISSVDQVSLHDELLIHMRDGNLQSTVINKHKDPQD